MRYKHLAVWPQTHERIRRVASDAGMSIAEYMDALSKDAQQFELQAPDELTEEEKDKLRNATEDDYPTSVTTTQLASACLDILQDRMQIPTKSKTLEIALQVRLADYFAGGK